ncbi:hypothetical protein TNIN_333481 [Trichonephila inaurata madagascariensis]|uniref:Uncharacterized protein n=1 Tax=Trichonephila inaurata madagascariensis TaxID=2747483 RepID=A0A8X7C698_9ARAC|nr:hypothetical protein TNIN_333481 [Trichonephila inaurata madagascariensis]
MTSIKSLGISRERYKIKSYAGMGIGTGQSIGLSFSVSLFYPGQLTAHDLFFRSELSFSSEEEDFFLHNFLPCAEMMLEIISQCERVKI